jgi:protein TorT
MSFASRKLIANLSVALMVGGMAWSAVAAPAAWFPYDAAEIEPNRRSPRTAKKSDISNMCRWTKASKAWDICVSFPHMKDAYWLGVDYGVAEEAKRLGVKVEIVEAGGYTELSQADSRRSRTARRAGANAVVIGAISGRRPEQRGLRDQPGGQEGPGGRSWSTG